MALFFVASLQTAIYSYTRSSTPESKVYAATSSNLNFQGRLLSASGNIVPDGYYNIEFKLYDSQAAGASAQGVCVGGVTDDCLWYEQYYDSNGVSAGNDNRVRVVNGYFSVSLGSQTAFPAMDWDQDMWLTVNIGGSNQTATPTYDGEMTPRTKLTAVPYAFQANNARSLNQNQGTYTGELDFATLTANRAITLPDADGTVCLQGSGACGFAASTGAAGYIWNGTSLQTANFNIRSANAADVAAIIQGAASQTADILQLQANGIIVAAFQADGKLVFGPSGSQDTNLYRSGASVLATDDSLSVGVNLTVTGTSILTGTLTVNNSADINTNSTTALQVRNGGTTTLQVDTTNNRVGIGGPAANGVLTVGTNTTGASGGIYFGTDTNLYRSASGLLATDGNLDIQGYMALGNNASILNTGTNRINLAINQTHTDLSGVTRVRGSRTDITVTPSANTAAQIHGSLNFVTLDGNNNFTGESGGGYNYVDKKGAGTAVELNGTTSYLLNSGTGAVTSLFGVDSTASTSGSSSVTYGAGMYSRYLNTGAGTTNSGSGVLGYAENYSTGQISSAIGLGASVGNYGVGTIDYGYGIFITTAVNSGGGTYANNYGMFIQDQSGVGSTNSYNLYSAGATAKNYIQGKLQVGSATTSGRINLGVDTDTTAAGGIYFGTDTTLFRSGANALATGGDLAVDGGDLITAATTATLFNTTATTLSIGGAATTLNIGPGAATATSINLAGGSGATGCTIDGATGNLTCSGNLVSGSNQAIVQNGNTLGAQAVIGTNDNNSLAFETNGTTKWTIGTDGHLLPSADDTYDIGSNTNRVRDIYAGPGTIRVGTATGDEGTLSYNTTTNNLVIGATNGVLLQNANDSGSALQVQTTSNETLFNVSTVSNGFSVTNEIGNPSFETDTSGWSTTLFNANSITRITTDAFSGSASGQVVTDAVGEGVSYTYFVPSSTSYTLSFYAKGTGNLTVGYYWNNSANQDPVCTSVPINSSTWTRINCSFTSQSGLAGSRGIYITQTQGGAQTWTIDAVQLVAGLTLPTYVSGGISLNAAIDSPVIFRNNANSHNSFQIQQADGTAVFKLDTVNGRISVGAASTTANGVLTVGTNTTAASGGIYFGTDTNIYRSGNNALTTDDALTVAGLLTGNAGATISGAAISLNNNSNFATSINTGNSTGAVSIGNTTAGSGLITIQSGNAAANAIRLNASNASGGIDIDAGTSGVTFDSTGAISLDSTAIASNFGLTANSASNAVLTLSASNAGAGTAAITLTADETINLNAGTIVGTATTQFLFDTVATTLNIGGAATTLNIGPGAATATSINLAGGSGATGCTIDGATGNLTCTGTISGAGSAFNQNGNSFAAQAVLGTNDSNSLAFETNGTTRWILGTDGHLIPNVNDTYDIGSDSNRVRDLYAGPGTIHIGTSTADEGTLSYNTTTNNLVLGATNGILIQGASSTTAFSIQDNFSNNHLVVDTTNDTTSTVTALTITNGSASGALNVYSGNSGNPVFINIGRASGDLQIGVAASPGQFSTNTQAGDVILKTLGSGSITFANGTDSVLNVLGGNVGIGVRSTSNKLEVRGNTVIAATSTTALNIQDASFNNQFTIDTSTDVTSTNTAFQVTNAAATGGIRLWSGASGSPTTFAFGRSVTEFEIGQVATNGQFSTNTLVADTVLRNTNSGAITLANGTTSVLNVLGGNVGIGIRSASTMLDVRGTTQVMLDSATAFRIQNASSQTLLVADTANQRTAIGPAAAAANGVLTVGTNTTAASGGMYFGTDTNLYRSGSNTLQTDDAFTVGGILTAQAGLSATNNGGKTTIQLTNTGTDTGITIGGDTNLYRSTANTLKTDDSLTIAGVLSVQKGNDYSTTGTSNDVDFGTTSFVRLTGATAQTITGITGGADGRRLTIINAGSASATISNDSGSSAIGNRVYTGTGSNLSLAVNSGIELIYDASGSGYWRATGVTTSSGGSFINNSTSLQTANFNIQSASTSSVGAIVQGASGQTADILQVQNNGTILAAFQADGKLVFGPSGSQDTNLYRAGADILQTDDKFVVDVDAFDSFSVRAGASDVNLLQAGNFSGEARVYIGGGDDSTGAAVIFGDATYDTGRWSLGFGDAACMNGGASSFCLYSTVGADYVQSVASSGATTFRTLTDSTSAYVFEDAAGVDVLRVDTDNQRVAIGPSAVPANGVLTVGTDTTAASGGLYFGTDTNLYRGAADRLHTNSSVYIDDKVAVGGLGQTTMDDYISGGIYDVGLVVGKTYTTTSLPIVLGLDSRIQLEPTAAPTGGYYAFGGSMSVSLDTAYNLPSSSQLVGGGMYANKFGTGSLQNLFGAQINSTNEGSGTVADMVGADITVQTYSSGTVDYSAGLRLNADFQGSSGSIGTHYGLYTSVSKSGSTSITNNYGLYVSNNSSSGITNNYGLYIGDQSGAGSTASYNLYSTGANSKNYFAGKVGISNTNPGYLLHVGDAGVTTGTAVARFENAGGTCTVTPNTAGGITCTSDERLKKDISSVSNEEILDKVLGINVVNYRLLTESPADSLHTGVLAQEFIEAFPDLVRQDADGYYSVSYAGLTPYLAGAIQAQQQQISKVLSGESPYSSLSVVGSAAIGGNLTVGGSTTTANLIVTNNATVAGTLSVDRAEVGTIVVNGHIITAGTAPLTEVLGANTLGATALVSGNDTLGSIEITTGSTPSSGEIVRVRFSESYGSPPKTLISPANEPASEIKFYRGDTTNEYFVLNFADTPLPNTTYRFDYFTAQ